MKRVLQITVGILFWTVLCVGMIGAQSTELDASYTTSDELLTFAYPSQWEFLDADQPAKAYVDRDITDITLEIELHQGLSQDDVLETFLALGDPLEQTQFELDGRAVVLVEMSVFRGIRDYYYVIELPDGQYASLWFVDQNDEFEMVDDTLQEILLSINPADEFIDPPILQTTSNYELDTSVPSLSGAFTITIPGDFLGFSSVERTPNNITMTNNWDIFTDEGIFIEVDDVLLIADYYTDALTFNLSGVTGESDTKAITEALVASQARESSNVTSIIAGAHQGYQFTSFDPAGLFFRTAVIPLDNGDYVTFVMVTASPVDQDELTALFVDIIATTESGVTFDRVGSLDLNLSQAYSRTADGFTMPYPTGWVVDVNPVGQSQFVTVTTGHTFDLNSPPIPGQPTAIIAYGTMEDLTGLPSSMLNPETNAIRVVQQIIGVQPEEVIDLEIRGYRAAHVLGSNETFDNWFVAIMLNDSHFVAANMFTAPQADEDFFGVIIEMISRASWNSLQESGGALVTSVDLETFTAQASTLSLQFPAGWSGFEVSPEIVGLINVDEAFDKLTSQDAPEAGQIVVTLFTHKMINNFGADAESIATQLGTMVFTDGVDTLEATEIDGRTLYVSDGEIDGADKLVILVPIDDNVVLLSALTAPDELVTNRDTLLQIALSMTLEQTDD